MIDLINEILPPALGIFVLVVTAGFMGVFRAMSLRRQSNDDTIDSLQRQIKILEQEIELYKKLVDKNEEKF